MVRKSLRGLNILFLLLVIISTFCSCTAEMNMFGRNNNKQINFSISIPSWKDNDSIASNSAKAETRATPITDTFLGTDKTFGIIADAVNGSNYTTEINQEVVSYNTANKIWETAANHYWPDANKTVNFYAYYPASITNGTITHTAGTTPTLTYTVPADATTQLDIMTATGTNVSGSTNTSTPLSFNHIFAAIQFSVGSAGIGSGTISSISIRNVANSGTYTFGSGWSNVTGSKTFTISQSKTITGTSGEDIYSGTYTLMMIPQAIDNVTITITYSNGGTLTKVISGSWEAGNIYNYKLAFIREYNYTGNVQSFTAPISGTYKLETWGAQGGGPISSSVTGGKGAYVTGNISLLKGITIYLYIGQQPSAGVGGWNGGGSNLTAFYGGGGATDISLCNGNWNDSSHLYSRIIVSGGGGGYGSELSTNVYQGGDGGAWNGSNGVGDDPGYGATISAVGANSLSSCNTNSVNPGFGYGGSSSWYTEGLGAGGGGWYGGGSAGGQNLNGSGGGGSSYAWSPPLAAYYPSSSYKPSTSYYLSNVSSYAGVNIGNGHARITFVSAN